MMPVGDLIAARQDGAYAQSSQELRKQVMISDTDRKEIAFRVYDPDSRHHEWGSDLRHQPPTGRPSRPTPLGLDVIVAGLYALYVYTEEEWESLGREARQGNFISHEGLRIRLAPVPQKP